MGPVSSNPTESSPTMMNTIRSHLVLQQKEPGAHETALSFLHTHEVSAAMEDGSSPTSTVRMVFLELQFMNLCKNYSRIFKKFS